MSTYENYTNTSGSYDATRSAVGLEIWLGHLLSSGQPGQSLRLLDAGCGTGNYTAALAPYVGSTTAMDMNGAMLAKARQKMADDAQTDRVRFIEGSALEMPLDDNEYDAVLFNQVLHHLDRPGDEEFPGCAQAIAEAARVLKPGGTILINACSRRQLESAFWYYHLAPGALSAVVRQQAPSARLRQFLARTGFSVTARTVPLDETMMTRAAYLDAAGPLRDDWRAGDSFWSLVEEAELDTALKTVRKLDAENNLQRFMETHDAERPHLGQMTFWIGQRLSG